MQQAFMLKDYLFSKPFIAERASLWLPSQNQLFRNVFFDDNLSDVENSFKKMNIGFVLIQKDLIDNSNESKVSYEKYDEYFKKNKNFSLLGDNKYFSLYKNKIDSSILVSNNLFYKRINPTKYKLKIRINDSDSNDVVFLRNFSTNWKIFINPINQNFYCNNIAHDSYLAERNVECIVSQKFFEGEELSYLYKKPIFDDTHKTVFDYANQWTIDPQYIKQNFPKEYYKENPDGSIDVELTLYFKPQSYFYLGLIISGTTFLSCLGYLVFIEIKKRKNKKE